MNKVVAIVGMCGTGKSIAVDYFLKKGFKKVYFGGITLKKLQENNMDITPDNEKIMSKKLRSEYGMGAYALISLPEIKELLKENNVIIDGLYSWDELKILDNEFKENIITIAIITNKKLRYERLAQREFRPFNNDEARIRDIFEIENSAKGGPIGYADYYVLNNKSVSDLENKLEEIVEEIL